MRRHRRGPVIALLLGFLAAGVAQPAGAQRALAPTTEWTAAPVFAAWRFGTAFALPAGSVTGVRQVAAPLRLRFKVNNRWTVDASGAVSSSTMQAKDQTATRTLTLTGLSDVNVRLTGPLAGGMHLTAGITLPVGATQLDSDETAVLQTIAAPALGMPVSALGLGLGGTLGLLGARQFGPWALALGASVEQRSEYTPIEHAIASSQSRTTLKPGTAAHFSFGADRSLGDQRLALLFVADGYAEDALTSGTGSAQTSSQYTLGPQVTAMGRLEFAAPGWRETAASASYRMRSEYSDATGSQVAGSGGSYLEASIGGVRGRLASPGLILAADARYHTGLDFTNALVGASVTAAGATIGIDWPFAEANLRVALRAQAGSLKTDNASSTITGLQLSGSLSARGGAR